MNLKEYAALQVNNTQEPQQAQEALPIDQLADRLQAAKYSSLLDTAQAAIDDNAPPAAMLQTITEELFGETSTQAAAVALLIEKDNGGYAHQIAGLRERKRLLNKQLRQLEEMTKKTTEEIKRLEDEARTVQADGNRAAAIDESLLEVLTFCNQTVMDPQSNLMREAARLYDRHRSCPVAMGLLYGCLIELARRQYSAGRFDMVDQREYSALKDRIKSAIET